MGVSADTPVTVRVRPKDLATCMQVRGPWMRVEARWCWLTVESVEKITRRSEHGHHTVYKVCWSNGASQRFAPNSYVEVTAHSYYAVLGVLGDTVMDWPLHHDHDDVTRCAGQLRYYTPPAGLDVTIICGHAFYFDSPRQLLQQVAQHAYEIKHEGAR